MECSNWQCILFWQLAPFSLSFSQSTLSNNTPKKRGGTILLLLMVAMMMRTTMIRSSDLPGIYIVFWVFFSFQSWFLLVLTSNLFVICRFARSLFLLFFSFQTRFLPVQNIYLSFLLGKAQDIVFSFYTSNSFCSYLNIIWLFATREDGYNISRNLFSLTNFALI